MKGRRISSQSPGELIAQQNPDVPVIKQGHWTQKSDAELDKQDDVDLLRVKFLFTFLYEEVSVLFF